MSQVETIALWAGLFASIASIVLSVVATLFAIWVNGRASEINDQMIRSLQKIDSSVDRVSTDTRELITAAWNKMLSGMSNGIEPEAASAEDAESIAGGVASEIESELRETESEEPAAKIHRLEEALSELQATVAGLTRTKPNGHGSDAVDVLTKSIRDLPAEARALLSILARGRHLTRTEYRSAVHKDSLKEPIKALRRNGLLMPLQGTDGNQEVPVYWLPSRLSRAVRIALKLAGDPPNEVIESLAGALTSVGYRPSA